MSSSTASPPFVRRFDQVRTRMLQVQVARALLRAALLAVAGLALLAGADYLWETARVVRVAGLFTIGAASLALAARGIFRALREWNRPRTAAEIEDHFPELGQSVRTTVQFGGRSEAVVAAEGVRSTLVTALEEQTNATTAPLAIEDIVPTGRLRAAAIAVAAVALALLLAVVIAPEWRTAARRTLLDEQPYTRLAVSPGDFTIEQGRDMTIEVELAGRTDRIVVLETRAAASGNADWEKRELVAEDVASTDSDSAAVRYEVAMRKINEPFEYRVRAGTLESELFHVTVRYPLNLKETHVELTPPEYTGLAPTQVADGNVSALEGTHAQFRFVLDRPPIRASAVFGDPRDRLRPAEERTPEVVSLNIDGSTLTMDLDLTADRVYSLEAEAADGMKLPANSFHIRVRKDQPPQLWFEEPREALEVHTLAELLMRVRLRDDFGLTRGGIVFQVNNEEEKTLLFKEFEPAESPEEGRRPVPVTQSALEKVLPLEYFELTEKDSVTYYAFAEDNYPGGARRTETDLRFIDIRPFKRRYKVDDRPDMPGMPGGREIASLGELIARQRFALNRTMQLARRPEVASASDLNVVDRLIEFEGKIAEATRELAEFLESRNVPGNDLLFQAEEAMLASVDSLSAGKYDTATLQEKDALRYLIEARETLLIVLPKQSRAVQAAVRAFDRMQTQKLRKPKNNDDAEAVAERLRELAEQEQFVYETLSGLKMDSDEAAASGAGESSGKPKKQTEKPSKSESQKSSSQANADSQKKDEAADKADQEGEQSEGDKGSSGESDKSDKEGSKDGDKSKDAGKSDEPGDGGEANKPAGPSREEIARKQIDIVAEAAAIEQVMQKIEGLSDLAKARIAEALKTAEQVSGALERGETNKAADSAEQASGMFRELARNVEGLTTKETATKIAMARSISDELSQLERELGKRLEEKPSPGASSQPQDQPGKSKSPGKKGDQPGDSGEGNKPPDKDQADAQEGQGPGDSQRESQQGGGSGGGDGKRDDDPNRRLASRADRLAEGGKTLEDVLKAIAKSNDPADAEAVRQVREMMEESKIGETVKRMQAQGPQIRAGQIADAQSDSLDIADRLEVTGQRLAVLHRSIVAPRVAELLKLAEEAAKLQEDLGQLENDVEITRWHREADEIVASLEKMELSDDAREELVEAMREAGWNPNRVNRDWGWARVANHYGAPRAYRRAVGTIVTDLQERIEELILAELLSVGDEAVPTQYQKLVERYYQVLSSDVRNK